MNKLIKKIVQNNQLKTWKVVRKFTIIFSLIIFIFVFSPGKLLALEENIDRPGSDYKNFSVSSPELCQKSCRTDVGLNCKAFTYVKSTKTCWLKNEIPLAKSNSSCISGVVRKNICVHGNTAQLQNKGVDAYSLGTGIKYYVSGTGSWIQYSIPTSEADTVIEGIQLKFTISNPKYGWISAVHVYDSKSVLQRFDNQRYGSSLSSEKRKTIDLLLPLSKPVQVKEGVGISILPQTDTSSGLKNIVNFEIHSVCALITDAL